MAEYEGGMSMQTLLEMNDIPEAANEPGPGHYFGPESVGFSAIGRQRFSKNASAPEISLPRTGWDSWEKVRVSKSHSKAYVGRDSPGAAYDVTGLLNQKTTKIGTSKRPPLSVVDPHGSPGPAYNVRDAPGQSIGYGVTETTGRLKKGFGLASRFGTDKDGGCGPGEYPRKDTSIKLGSGKSIGNGRAAWEKVCTPGWEVEGRCRASPGPGAPLWRDIKTDGSRSTPFGRAERFARDGVDKGPGPGSYKRNERDVGNQRQHLSDTRTASVVGFGAKPKKPRFRPQLAMNTGKHGAWGYF